MSLGLSSATICQLIGAPDGALVGVLDPDDGHVLPPRLVDQAGDVADDHVAFVRTGDDAVLHVDDEEGGVRPVLERGHGLTSFTLGSRVRPR